MLEIKNLSRYYYPNGKNGEVVKALNGVNLSFPEAGFVSILGKSGSGKTTLLNMIGGMDSPDGGEVRIDGKRLADFKNKDYDEYRNFDIGFIFQDYNLLREYTVLDNVRLAVRLQERDKEKIETRAAEALEKVGLLGFENRKINQLSGGQQQRVVIARAIAKNSRVILCDEPTGNLDSKTSLEIMAILKDVSNDRLVLLVTHDHELALEFSGRIIKLKDGEVAEDSLAPSESEQKYPTKSEKARRKRGGWSFPYMLRMIWDNIKSFKAASIAIAVLFLAVFTLTVTFSSLTEYSSLDAFAETLKANNQTVIQITRFTESTIKYTDPDTGEEKIIYQRPQTSYEHVKESDIPGLYQKVDNKANFYPSYFFVKNFHDFTDTNIIPEEYPFEAVGFREAIAVADFSTFHMEYLAGGHPKADDEVIIYDYMAYSLIYRGVLDCTDIKDTLNERLTDINSGLSFKIVGILKSDYLRYMHIKENPYDSKNFEKTYIASLQSVFCRPGFIEFLKPEKPFFSIIQGHVEFENNRIEMGKRAKYLTDDDILGMTFFANIPDFNTRRGLVITKAQAAALLGMDEASMTAADAKKLLKRIAFLPVAI